jgi:hypothetical protein
MKKNMSKKGARIGKAKVISSAARILTDWIDRPSLDALTPLPDYALFKKFAALLDKAPAEEVLQQFLTRHPAPIFALGSARKDVELALIAKPRVGQRYVADFCVVSIGQGGGMLHFIEIETADANLFTQRGTPARRLQQAFGQITDWSQWINANRETAVRDVMDHVSRLPLLDPAKKLRPPSYRLVSDEFLRNTQWYFADMTGVDVDYVVVIGRWSSLSDRHRRRLQHFNNTATLPARVVTYDHVARALLRRHTLPY